MAGLLFLLSIAQSRADDGAAARQVVQQFCDRLTSLTRQEPRPDYEDRVSLLQPAVVAAYDMPTLARSTVGPAAQRMSPAELDNLATALLRFTAASYAVRFEQLSGVTFEVGKASRLDDDRVSVTSRMVPASGDPLEIDYIMHRDARGEWKAVDVLIGGTISQLAVQRAEFTSIVRHDGVAQLISGLDRKASTMGRTSSSSSGLD
jgi:phospholipid transport system substrate-binding protein